MRKNQKGNTRNKKQKHRNELFLWQDGGEGTSTQWKHVRKESLSLRKRQENLPKLKCKEMKRTKKGTEIHEL